MKTTLSVLLDIIKSELYGAPLDLHRLEAMTTEEIKALCDLASSHMILPLVGDFLGKNKVAMEEGLHGELLQKTMMSVVQTDMLEREIHQVCQLLGERGIPYIKLKGARIRGLYPEPWMRVSCDMDILVHEEDADRAAELLVTERSYRRESKGFHDIQMFSPTGIHLELHFTIKENDPVTDPVLDRVWQYSTPAANGSKEYLQSDAFFVFHIISHMARHFQGGGCGIRSLVDMQLIREQIDYDEAQVQALCSEAGIEKFYGNIVALTEVWFGDLAHTEATERMEQFIVTGGVFGCQKNAIAVSQKKTGGKLGYIWHRLFLPYRQMVVLYPALEDHRWLMPVCHLRRWANMVRQGRLKLRAQELKRSQQMDDTFSEGVRLMLEENGLLK